VDATLGGGGYSQAILDKLTPKGKLLSIDLDPVAIENAEKQKTENKNSNWTVSHGNFRDIDKMVVEHGFPAPNGIVADLGLSSYELDQAGRGMSFEKEELLDMRFDPASEESNAEFIVNNYDYGRLVKVFRNFGEEKFSGQIAKRIVKYRETNKIKYTTELLEIIESALPKPVRFKAKDSARRVFQALRIEVNHELENLEQFLSKAFDLLAPGGRMAVVSFHSLEDRLVKQYFASLGKGCVCPIEFPQCLCGKNPQAKIITKKPIIASEQEIKINSRSKPAKLRAITKI
jgi:16S rRNA (cytosine1402-N4)-methyltransferase